MTIIDPEFEERDPMYQLSEIASYYKTYSSSLEKEITQKDAEIQKLNLKIQALEDDKKRVKGDLKTYKKDVYVTGLVNKIKKLEKDNEALLCKVAAKHIKQD